MTGSVLVRGGRIVGLHDGVARDADVRVRDGVIVEVGPRLDTRGETLVDAAGGWVIPGLWDAHVHFGQYVRSTTWLDVSGASGPDAVCDAVATALAGRTDDRPLITFGHRSSRWDTPATVAALDAASGTHPVVAIAGDAHHGWLNSAALACFGLPARTTPLVENDWFAVFGRLGELSCSTPTPAQEDAAIAGLSARGLVGLVDLEFDAPFRDWPRRIARGQRSLRVRAGVYPHQLDDVLAAGWRSGDPLPGGEGLARMGPLKIIADGSMGTRTAWCATPYLDAAPDDPHPAGCPNVGPDALASLLGRARAGGLEVAVHAIGDRANAGALDAFAATGARGSIEHAQLLCAADLPRFASLGIRASMQPHHLVADRDPAARLWGDRTDRLYRARSLLRAGAVLALGSDAPVSPPDPWLAIATAVHRSGDDRPGWHAEESLSPREALAASVDGRRIAVGEPGDVVVLDADPLAPFSSAAHAHAHLAGMGVRTTVCAGRITHGGR